VRDRKRGGVWCWFKVGNNFVSCGCLTLEVEEVKQKLVVLTLVWIVWELSEGWSSSFLGGGVVSIMRLVPHSVRSSA